MYDRTRGHFMYYKPPVHWFGTCNADNQWSGFLLFAQELKKVCGIKKKIDRLRMPDKQQDIG